MGSGVGEPSDTATEARNRDGREDRAPSARLGTTADAVYGTAMWVAVLALLAAQPSGDAGDGTPPTPPREVVQSWATDMVDPAGLTRFHLTTHATFADASSAFSGNTTWAIEARGHIRLTRGVALSAVVPVGLTTREDAYGFFGNLALGLGVGGTVHTRDTLSVRLGGAFDVYLPTASGDPVRFFEHGAVAAVRAYEPTLYLPRSLSFRGRFLGEVDVGPLAFAAELGLTPSVSLAEDADGFALLFGFASRVSMAVVPAFEPFLELSAVTQVAGDGELAPPVLLTPGVRLHLAEAFDPAIFVSFNFVAAHAVIIGLDLATVIRPAVETGKRRKLDRDDFFER